MTIITPDKFGTAIIVNSVSRIKGNVMLDTGEWAKQGRIPVAGIMPIPGIGTKVRWERFGNDLFYFWEEGWRGFLCKG